ncbi:MAG: hypothetical protein PHH60_00980 [Candidatus Margulisbacteria bacterium]|nr:hypothetical protein [Candidatus Margulisiibacteriota bacterium]
MSIITLAGSGSASLRCYALSHAATVRHLECGGRLKDIREIQEAVHRFTDPTAHGVRAVLFVEQRQLPPDLVSALESLDIFHNFCQAIGFAAPVYQLTVGRSRLPSSKRDHGDALFMPCHGIPVTNPVADELIDPTVSYSFGETEVQEFLGGYSQHAGRLVILNLRDGTGQRYLTPKELSNSVDLLTRILVQNENPPRQSYLLH